MPPAALLGRGRAPPLDLGGEQPYNPWRMRRLYRILSSQLFGVCVVVGSLAGLLLIIADTPGGRWTAAGMLGALPSLILLSLSPLLQGWRQALGVALAGFLGAMACLGVAASSAPDGQTEPDARFQSIWFGQPAYPRYGLANLVPETDQFKLGSYVAVLDPWVDIEQSIRIRRLFGEVYRELEADPGYARAGSSMSYAYRDLFGLDGRSDHLYLVLPEDRPVGERLPVVLFLHGSLGNFKGYSWVLRGLADACGVAIVSPDHGAGFWAGPEGVETVRRALHFAEQHPLLDAEHPAFIGLSGGGPGISRAAIAMPERWRELVYLSALLESTQMPAVAQASSRPILVLSGAKDRRIPEAHTAEGVEELTRAGAEVERVSWPEEDHFLLFSQRKAVIEALAARMRICQR